MIHASGEWYSGVSQYQIMEVDSARSQSSGDFQEYHVLDELKPVFNFGAGIEWQVSDAFSVYGSLVRDGSAAPENLSHPFAFGNQVSNSLTQADRFHLGAGVSLEAKWIDFTAGLNYGAMNEGLENPLNGTGPDPGIALPIEPDLTLSTRRWRFLVGFSIPMVVEISDQPGTG